MTYVSVKIKLTEHQVKQAIAGKPIRLNKSQIGHGDGVSLHPANVKVVEKAALRGSGCVIHLSHGELLDTAHKMQGSGFWGDVWGTVKNVWKAAKDSGLATKAADFIAQKVGDAAEAYAPGMGRSLTNLARNKVKEYGGFGVRKTKAQKREELVAKGLYLS